jgi:hypothetical protein
MLYIISKVDDMYVSLLDDDPVRPWISREFRCHMPDNCVFVLLSGSREPRAVLCCSFKSFVPSNVDELLKFEYSRGSNAIFYSVWSYSRGGGREIIPLASAWIRENLSHVSGFYTFSPCSDRVREFHYSLGAKTHRKNSDSINYIY